MSGTLRAYLELSRLSNVPTVLSNALAGAVCAAFPSREPLPIVPVVSACAASMTLYVAGMALNDLFDRTTDAQERPTRPIPSGRVSVRGAGLFAGCLVAIGIGLLASIGIGALVAGLTLVACILVYDLMHAATVWSVVVMGTCRGLVYVVGALAIGVPDRPILVLGPAIALALYVAGFSIVARREAVIAAEEPKFACSACGYPSATDHGRCSECGRRFGPERHGSVVATGGAPLLHLHASHVFPLLLLGPGLLFGPTLVSHGLMDVYQIALGVLAIGVIVCVPPWMLSATAFIERRPPQIGRAVTIWIACISLFDAHMMLMARSLGPGAIAVACFILTRWAQRRIAGT